MPPQDYSVDSGGRHWRKYWPRSMQRFDAQLPPVHWRCTCGRDRLLRVRTYFPLKYSRCDTVRNVVHVYICFWLCIGLGGALSKGWWHYSHCRDSIHISRLSTNAAQLVNESNGGIIQSEITLWSHTHVRISPNQLDLTSTIELCSKGPEKMQKHPIEILFRVTLDTRHWTLEAEDTTAMR